jgi:hypothetical protein
VLRDVAAAVLLVTLVPLITMAAITFIVKLARAALALAGV